jgi:PHP family Zn ribbon phosphoesterase
MSGLKNFKADLHIHSCLSPCGDWNMSPKRIVQKSSDIGLDLIAVCDHNTVENAAVVMNEGLKKGVHVLPGLEICSKEEVHILALFDEIEPALKMQAYVYSNLPGENNPDLFGFQVVANEKDEVLSENPRLLIGATRLGLHQIVEKTHTLKGLSVCCHVDRPAFGVINQLGFIPSDLALDGVEISYRVKLENAHKTVSGIDNLSCITSSDAHFLDDIGKAQTVFCMAAPTVNEIRLALQKKDGRRIVF